MMMTVITRRDREEQRRDPKHITDGSLRLLSVSHPQQTGKKKVESKEKVGE
jgi:hypothetical protein